MAARPTRPAEAPPLNDRFAWDGDDIQISQCSYCVRWNGDGTCEAYPQQVPMEIRRNQADHRQEYPGDHGMRYLGRRGTKHPMGPRKR